MNIEVRERIRAVLRSKLLGKENNNKKQLIMETLNVGEGSIKGWTIPSSTNIPSADDLPIICKILDISYYELFGEDDPNNSIESRNLYNAYKSHPDDQSTIKKILDIK